MWVEVSSTKLNRPPQTTLIRIKYGCLSATPLPNPERQSKKEPLFTPFLAGGAGDTPSGNVAELWAVWQKGPAMDRSVKGIRDGIT